MTGRVVILSGAARSAAKSKNPRTDLLHSRNQMRRSFDSLTLAQDDRVSQKIHSSLLTQRKFAIADLSP